MKKIIKVFLLISLSFATTLGPSFAAGNGSTAAQFLQIGAGARAAGMGEAFSSVADDASAIYYNPAGMAQLKQKELTVSYNAYFQDTAAQFLGYSHPTESIGTFGVSANIFSVKNIEQRSAASDSDTPDSTFNTKDSAYALGWANKLARRGYELWSLTQIYQLRLKRGHGKNRSGGFWGSL